MPKKRQFCKNDPDTFCYICEELTLLKYRGNLTDKIKRFITLILDVRLETKIKFDLHTIVA